MITAPGSISPPVPGTTGPRGPARRILALGRAEAALLRRNPGALGSALVAPILLVLVPFSNAPVPGEQGISDQGSLVVTGLATFALILGVYYNLVTALVARREEYVLKRLRTGALSDGEIIAGTALPAVAITWAQIAIGVIAAASFLHLQAPTNPALAVVAVILGTAVCILLAAAMTALTSRVEMAQLTAAPALIISMIFSGVMFPLHQLPEAAQRVAEGLPLAAVVTLVRLGLTGTTSAEGTVDFAGSFDPALVPLLVLGAWVALGTWAVRRWFRWEPRH
jgi:ABC-2 type transport system permease protein